MSSSSSSRSLRAFVLCYVLVSVSFCFFAEEERKPVYLTAAVGDHVVFNCDLDFPQDIAIPYILHWNKEGKTVFSWYDGVLTAADPYVGRIQLLETIIPGYGLGSVNLTSIRESDAGWFECRVLFPNRTPSSRNNGTWFYLTVNGGNLLAEPPINRTTLEGDEANFTCITKMVDTIVTWYKDGVPIRDLSDLLQRSWVHAGTLTIHPTTMVDLGEYECEAINSLGERQTARAYLNIQYKAKVIYAPREVYLPYGRSAILDCHFRANPPLTNLRWEKDGFLFDPYNVQGVFYRRNGSLYFSKVDETHSGHYSCTPYNDLGTDGPSPSIHVVVQRPPVFVITPHNLYLRKLGETLQMPCDARDGEGSHKPTIVWYKKDGSPLPIGRYLIQDGNITILNIQEDDRGLYQCSATNEAATISAETELLVENVAPRAPYNLTANSSMNAVTLRWIAGRMRPEMEYSVWYRPVDTSEWRTMKILSKKTTEATIPNLLTGREYEFMVLSQDRHGDGMFSKTLRVWTPRLGIDGETEEYRSHPIAAFVPIGPPRNVTVEMTSDGYLVSWDPPGFGVESLRIYVVRWSQGTRELLSGTAETKDTYYVVRKLEEDNVYHFQVIAMSTNDYQAISSKVEVVVPAYKRIRAVSVGVTAGIAFLALAFVAVFFIKKKWCKSKDRKSTEK